jgi:hypothetical protein
MDCYSRVIESMLEGAADVIGRFREGSDRQLSVARRALLPPPPEVRRTQVPRPAGTWGRCAPLA